MYPCGLTSWTILKLVIIIIYIFVILLCSATVELIFYLNWKTTHKDEGTEKRKNN